MDTPIFRDRADAGRRLAKRLRPLADAPGLLVLGLPRGGVPVAWEVARALGAPMDIFLVRKLGMPGHEELAIGAIASGGVRVVNRQVIDTYGIGEETIARVAAEQQRELERREWEYREGRTGPNVAGRTIILVDDGLATGSSMRAAILAVRAHEPERLVVAVPVASQETCAALRPEVDDIICVATPEPFLAVGLWYEEFSQTSDEEVRALLRRAEEELGAGASSTQTDKAGRGAP